MLDENVAPINRTVDQMAHQRFRSESYCNCTMFVRITDAVHAVCTSARLMYVCEYRVLQLGSRRITDTHNRAQKVVQDVHHCFEITSHNMCRLYNTAAMAAAETIGATALVASVRP